MNNILFKLKFYGYKLKNSSRSLKVLYIGIIILIFSIATLIYLNLELNPFKDITDFVNIIISLTLGLCSFIIAISSLYYTKEQTVYGMIYEKRKNGLIRLYHILFFNTIFFAPKIKLEFVTFVLDLNPQPKKLETFLKKLKKGPTISRETLTERTEKPFLEDLVEFKKDYEIYYLPKELLYEFKYILKDKTELEQEDVLKMILLIERYVEKEFGIKL